MAKIAVKKDSASSVAKEKNSVKQTKNQKKKKFWKNHPKVAVKDVQVKKVPLPLPPKAPQEFSSNWKALQALLKPEISSSVTNSTSTKPSEEKVPRKEEKVPRKEEKVPRKEEKVPRKEEKVPKKEEKVPRKEEKVPRKEEKVPRKEEKVPRKEEKVPKKEEKVPRKEEKVPRKEEKVPRKDNSESKTKKTLPKINGREVAAPPVKKANKVVKETGPIDKRKKRKLNSGDEKHSVDQKRKMTADGEGEIPKIDIWFDDVDPEDIEAAMGPEAGQIARKMQGVAEKKSDKLDMVLVKDRAFEGLTRTVAMDCEMVGVGADGEESILARISIVNQFGKCVYDKFVKPTERVTDYRTEVSGIRPPDIKNGEEFKIVQKEVSEILKGRVLVGHAVHNDLKILFLDHPKKAVRDTQKYKPFRQRVKSGRPSLKLLCEQILNVRVQTGEHCSIQDAQAAMRLYTMEKKNWEAAIKAKYNGAKSDPPKQKPTAPH